MGFNVMTVHKGNFIYFQVRCAEVHIGVEKAKAENGKSALVAIMKAKSQILRRNEREG